jgi:hypothetical protein
MWKPYDPIFCRSIWSFGYYLNLPYWYLVRLQLSDKGRSNIVPQSSKRVSFIQSDTKKPSMQVLPAKRRSTVAHRHMHQYHTSMSKQEANKHCINEGSRRLVESGEISALAFAGIWADVSPSLGIRMMSTVSLDLTPRLACQHVSASWLSDDLSLKKPVKSIYWHRRYWYSPTPWTIKPRACVYRAYHMDEECILRVACKH